MVTDCPPDTLRSHSVRAIRRFTIHPVLPEPLAPLQSLMLNLRWSWHTDTMDLFATIDPAGWERVGHDPAALLASVPPDRLASLAADRRFLRRLSDAVEDLREYTSAPRWYQSQDQPGAPPAVAYFSPEYGITAALPQYSGGLGILAGDHLKAASDLGVPLIGVGLLYRHGYFTQSLSAEGWQAERYPASDPNGLPLTLLRDGQGEQVKVRVTLAGESALTAQVWVAQIGRVPLLLLDSYVEENDPELSEVTDRLYGGASDHRLRQELLLGIGGVRAVRAFCAITSHRGARGIPHQRGPCGLSRPRAHPRVRPAGPVLRRGDRDVPGRNRVHHAHPGARRDRQVQPGSHGAAVRRQRGRSGAAVRPGPGPRRGDLPGRRS